MRARKKEKEGDFIEAQIAPSVFAYGRLVDAVYLFYDFTTTKPLQNVEELLGKPFIVGLYVMCYATREGHWKIIANAPVLPQLYSLLHQEGLVLRGVHSPMTAESLLREFFQVKGYEGLNPNFPWQTAST